MSIVEASFLSRLQSLTLESADDAPFGIVRLNDAGVVELYNRWESEMAGVLPSAAEGRNFFTEVAPCTNNRLFFGRFKEGVAKGALDVEFDYTFTYKMRPTNVTIRLYRDGPTRKNWVFVTRKQVS